jgi:regulator of sigma E protease
LLVCHELGHFLIARLFKVEIEEFGIGIPPRIIGKKIGGVIFSLNAIPFGAFVRPKGENDPAVEGGLASASPWVRLSVLFGGPVMNLLVGFIVFVILFSRVGSPDVNTVQIMEVAKTSPAELSGMAVGDVVISVNGRSISSMEDIQVVIQENKGTAVSIDLLRDGTTVSISVTPRVNPPEGEGPVGFVMGNPYMPIRWYEALPTAVSAMIEQGRQLILLPVRLIQGTIPSDQARVVGPKGIFDIYQAAKTSDAEAESSSTNLPAVNVLAFIGTISVALGLTNLFPIPALDGGRILFIIPEIILRKRVPAKYENVVHSIGMLTLLAFMVFITIQDFINPITLR